MEITKTIEKKARNLANDILEEFTNWFSESDKDRVANMIIDFLKDLD